MSDVLVKAENVSKKFCRSLGRSLWYGVRDIGAELMARDRSNQSSLRPEEFWAINDVSFELRRGECLGLIGANGAGKSTLLKMLNGLIKPDHGRITMRGRVGALIELGAGFHPLLSGRENIYVNAAILGMKKREVDKRLEQIIDFADIGPAIDSPVQTYSSGMRVRLGFAVAAHLEPDVLLIDEVLAVGDATFRAKCYRRLAQLLEQNTSIILVSHSAHTIMAVCPLGLYLNRGQCAAMGGMGAVMDAYQSESRMPALGIDSTYFRRSDQDSTTALTIHDIYFCDKAGQRITSPSTGGDYSLRLQISVRETVDAASLAVIICGAGGEANARLSLSSHRNDVTWSLSPGTHLLSVTFNSLGLVTGEYLAKLSVCHGTFAIIDSVDEFRFYVLPGKNEADSTFYQSHDWTKLGQSQIDPCDSTAERAAVIHVWKDTYLHS